MRLLPASPTPQLAAIFVLAFAACGAPDGESRTAATPLAAKPGSESEHVTARSVAELPANFPGDFPMPAELHIYEARFTEGDAWTAPNFFVRATSPLSVSELAAFYNERIPSAGYQVIKRADPGISSVIYFEGTDLRDCSVQFHEAQDETDVIISLPLRD